jgi:hypothetical protein
MYADDTSILNVGQDMNELQNTTVVFCSSFYLALHLISMCHQHTL